MSLMIEIARKSVPRNSLIRVAGKYVTWDQKCKDSCAKLVVNRVAGKIVTLDRNCKEICAKEKLSHRTKIARKIVTMLYCFEWQEEFF